MVAHFPDTEGVTSSNLVSPTRKDCLSRIIKKFWVIGAAASALPSHGRGHRFDSYITHALRRITSSAFFVFLIPFFICLSVISLFLIVLPIHTESVALLYKSLVFKNSVLMTILFVQSSCFSFRLYVACLASAKS